MKLLEVQRLASKIKSTSPKRLKNRLKTWNRVTVAQAQTRVFRADLTR